MKRFPTHIVAVYGVTENERNEILMVRHRKNGLWGFPGGQVESGENLIGALTRETMEESGVSIAVNRLFSASSNTCSYPGYGGYEEIPTKLILGFACAYVGGEPRPFDETSQAVWMPKDRVPELLKAPDLIEKYKAYLGSSTEVQYLEYVTKPEFELRLARPI